MKIFCLFCGWLTTRSQICNHVHIHTHIQTHTYTHTHTLIKVLSTVYRKSYQQYFDILLNCKKLKIYCYKKIKEATKEACSICQKATSSSLVLVASGRYICVRKRTHHHHLLCKGRL